MPMKGLVRNSGQLYFYIAIFVFVFSCACAYIFYHVRLNFCLPKKSQFSLQPCKYSQLLVNYIFLSVYFVNIELHLCINAHGLKLLCFIVMHFFTF